MLRTLSSDAFVSRCLRALGYTSNLPTASDYAQRVADCTNDALRHVWTFAHWPMLRRTERRTYRPPFTRGLGFAKGQECWHKGAYWRAETDGPASEPSEGNPEWRRLAPDEVVRFIALDQPWENTEIALGGVNLRGFAYARDPKAFPDQPPIVGCSFAGDYPGGGTTRISINPQTLSDEVLRRIGRRHTTQQTLDAFRLARDCGMDNINMDLIAGLPGDTVEGFRATLDGVLALAPESVTVHTLSLKRSAQIFQDGAGEPEAETAAAMLDYAQRRLTQEGYQPYYLYRQSRMVGNLENIGWCKPGCESPYNVYIMDETHTILACGAGAATKVKRPGADDLERIFNFKFPYEYIDRFQEVLERKNRVKHCYDQFDGTVRTLP